MRIKSLPPFKKGTTYTLRCIFKKGGVGESVEGLTIESQMRDKNGEKVADFEIIKDSDQSANAGVFSVVYPPNLTEQWMVGDYFIDLKMSLNGAIRNSETFKQPVIGRITR